MNLAVLQELEACCKSVPGLINIPVVWGIDPSTHSLIKSYPRIGVYTGQPQERELFQAKARIAYQVKISYFVELTSAWPTDLEVLADIHSKALDVRKAVRNVYARQITGESLADMDLEGTVDQEIAIMDRICVVGSSLTVVVTESV